MTDLVTSMPSAAYGSRTEAGHMTALRREMLGWAWLSVGALAVAGLFAILLALSRIPGIERVVSWPLGFFGKGLVIHVVFSLIVWLLGIFAFLVTVAVARTGTDKVRLAALGQFGQALVAVAFPCLFLPAFLDATEPELTNYVPLIRHPAYDMGLVLLAFGVLAPVVRLLANLPEARVKHAPVAFGATAASVVYIVALACFSIAAAKLFRAGDLQSLREQLFWGGGHVLEFVYTAVMLTNWMILARRSVGEGVVDPEIFRLSLVLVAVFSLPAPLFYFALQAFSVKQHDAYRVLQFVLVLPTLLFSVALLAGALKAASPARWPWRQPAFVALVTSLALFAVGGLMGTLISGSDTRTPAHYHAVVTAVSVSSMGMLLTFALDLLGKPMASERATRLLLLFYGGGQIAASLGMFLAGGYGAPRKMPTGLGRLVDAAAAGMFLHGLGAVVAVVGGAAFVVVAMIAFSRAKPSRPVI